MRNASTVRVYSAAHAIEAHVLRGLLGQAGIEAFLVGEHQNRVYGVFSQPFAIDICVPAADEPAARVVVERYEADLTGAARPGWTCASCGEINAASFDSCWQCGTVS